MITITSIIVVICLSRILVELFQLSFYSGEYLTSWINLIEGFLYVGTIIFVLSDFEYTCLNSWRWQLGALCIFLSWINFVLFMSKEPTFGIYICCHVSESTQDFLEDDSYVHIADSCI